MDFEEIASLVAVAREAKFRDPRHGARLAAIVAAAAADPTLSFPDMFADAAALEGAYRFFANSQVGPDEILSSHFESTCRASASESAVLVVHDSSTFAFDPEGKREGLGRVRSAGQAFFGHVSLVLADDGTRRPLGLSALTTWVRSEAKKHGENERWFESVELSAARLGGAHHLIHLMDREADDYGLFARMKHGGHRFVIRLKHDRKLVPTPPTAPKSVGELLAQIECEVMREARLSKRVDGGRSPKQKQAHPSRGQRVAKLSIGAVPITLKRSPRQDKGLPEALSFNFVRVWEPDPPLGEAPVEWQLLTSEPIDTADALTRIVDRYRTRWVIEISHSSCTSCHRSLKVASWIEYRHTQLSEAA